MKEDIDTLKDDWLTDNVCTNKAAQAGIQANRVSRV